MVLVVFVEPNGDRREVDVKEGRSAMEGAIREGVEGIVAQCSGQRHARHRSGWPAGEQPAQLPDPRDEDTCGTGSTDP